MAESVAVISLAASIVTFTDFYNKVIVRLQTLRGRVIEMPKDFRDILVLLPELLEVLGSTKQLDLAGLIERPAQVVFLPLVQSCYAELLEFSDILMRITPREMESSTTKAKRALQSTVYTKTVKKISSTLQRNVTVFMYALGPRRAISQDRSLSPGANQADIPFDRNRNFIGRVNILQQVRDSIDNGRNIALAGIGGVGKTQIALEAAYQYKETQHGRVFWVSASNFQRFDQCYKDIARSFMTLSDFKSGNTNILGSVRDWLNNHGPWLLILDNVDDTESFTANSEVKLATEFLPHSPNGSIIITARDMRVCEGLLGAGTCIAVPLPDQDEAEELLRSGIEPTVWDSHSGTSLVQSLERLPLALTQAAAFIKANNFTLDKYHEYFQRHSIGLVAPLNKEPEGGKGDSWTGNPAISTWKLSFDQIMSIMPLAADVLSLMSVLDIQGIPKILLTNSCEPDIDFSSAISKLQAFSLITVEKKIPFPARIQSLIQLFQQKTPNTFKMHPLVQSAVRLWMESEMKLVLWQRKAVMILREKFGFSSSEDLYLCQVLYPHARLVVEYKFRDPPDLLIRASLMTHMADYEASRNMLDIAQNRLISAYESMTELLGGGSLVTIQTRLQLASVLRMQGSSKDAERICRELSHTNFIAWKAAGVNDIPDVRMELALSLTDNDRAVRLLREIFFGMLKPDNSWNSVKILDNLGSCLLKQGKREEALYHHNSAFELKMRLLGPRSEWTLWTEMDLNYRTNPFDTNEGISRQTLASQEQILGAEHPDTLSGAFNLAKSLIRDLKYDEAKPLALRALAGSKKVLGAKHPQTLAATETVAILYKCLEQYELSATYFEKALKGFDKVLGQDHPETRSCWWGYLSLAWEWRTLDKDVSKPFPADHPVSLIRLNYEASALYDTGDYRRAEKLQRTSLALFEAEVGPDDLWTLTSACDLGLTLIELWNFSEAEKLFRRVLDGRRRKLEPDHRDTLKTMNALGVTLWNMKGEGLTEAEAIFRELLATRERLGQTEDVSYLSTRNNLALLEFERGDNEAALATHRALLVDRRRIQGKNHPETLLTMLSISMALGYMHNYPEALEWNQKAVFGLLIFPGPDHPNTLVARSHLAKIQSMVGELDAAEETIRSVIAARSRVLGPGHGNTLKSRARLGGILELRGRFHEALALEEDIYTVAVASLGVDHPETRGHKGSLEALRYRIREIEVAANCGTENHDDASRMKT